MSNSSTVRQHYKQPPIYEELTKGHEIFDTKLDLFVFAACVGYAHGRCLTEGYEGSGDDQGEMHWMHFSDKDLYRAIAASIAYQHHHEASALVEPTTQLETFAMYAAGGIEVIEDKFGDIKGDPTDAILSFIQDWDEKDDTDKRQTVLGDIMGSFDDEMYADDSLQS